MAYGGSDAYRTPNLADREDRNFDLGPRGGTLPRPTTIDRNYKTEAKTETDLQYRLDKFETDNLQPDEAYVTTARRRGKNLPHAATWEVEPERQDGDDASRYVASKDDSKTLLLSDAQRVERLVQTMKEMNERMDKIDRKRPIRKFINMKPPKYDGSTPLLTFLSQFEIRATRNQWMPEERVDFLKLSLEGQVAQLLWDATVKEGCSYEQLVQILHERYGSRGQTEVFRAQLRNLRQKPGDSLACMVAEVRRLMCMAYPGNDSDMSQIIAKDAFIDSLVDGRLSLRIREREPHDIN